jgi:hypothetical protein
MDKHTTPKKNQFVVQLKLYYILHNAFTRKSNIAVQFFHYR